MITFMLFLDADDDGLRPNKDDVEEALRNHGLAGRVMTVNGEDEED